MIYGEVENLGDLWQAAVFEVLAKPYGINRQDRTLYVTFRYQSGTDSLGFSCSDEYPRNMDVHYPQPTTTPQEIARFTDLDLRKERLDNMVVIFPKK